MQNVITFNDHSGKLYQNNMPYTNKIFIDEEDAFNWLKEREKEKIQTRQNRLTQQRYLIE